MKRRNFLGALGALFASGGVLKTLPSDYRPVGYLKAGDPSAVDAKVWLDGHKVTHVFELDDLEGWLRRYVPEEEHQGIGFRIERLTGDVRVTWKGQA